MKLVTTIVVMGIAVSSFGAVLVDEQFTHANGNLVGQTPTPGPGGIWAAHSGAGTGPIQVNSNEAIVAMGVGSEDVNTAFAAIGAGTTIYAGFDLRVPTGSTMAGENYFAHFRSSASFAYPGRIFLGPPAAGGSYSIGLRASGTAPTVLWASDLAFDTTYRVVVSYEFDTGNSSLWINPTGIGDTNITDGTDLAPGDFIDSFALRQSTGFTANIAIDNLEVGTAFGDVPVELQTFSVE